MDLAEVLGGAIALHILFGIPLLPGGVIVGAVSMLLLALQFWRRQRPFEFVITGLLAMITIGFVSGLFLGEVSWSEATAGIVPRFEGTQTLLLAAGMLGATVMPHAIYAHSAITDALGRAVGIAFGIGLLASGLASTLFGCYAGSTIMAGLLHRRILQLARRAIILIPALAIIAAGVDPTQALVLSQVVLSLGIPFALIPLVRLTGDWTVMGRFATRLPLRLMCWTIVVLIVALNLALITLMVLWLGCTAGRPAPGVH